MKTVYLIYEEPSGGIPSVKEIWDNKDKAEKRREELQKNKLEPGQIEKLWCDYYIQIKNIKN